MATVTYDKIMMDEKVTEAALQRAGCHLGYQGAFCRNIYWVFPNKTGKCKKDNFLDNIFIFQCNGGVKTKKYIGRPRYLESRKIP